MKPGAENRRKTVMAGALGAVALCCILYAYNTLFGGPDAPTPPPSIAATTPAPPPRGRSGITTAGSTDSGNSLRPGQGSLAGVSATRLATTSASLDPTLDERAMLRTESLQYAGSGRNIFSATYTAPLAPLKLPTYVPSARPQAVTLPPAPSGPPPPPPINLKYFGTASRSGGARQAFLLSGEDVYLASPGEIVARKYKVLQIGASSITIEDLQNNNTQTLPLIAR